MVQVPYRPSESDLYKHGSVVATSNVNKRNEQIVKELNAKLEQQKTLRDYNAGAEDTYRSFVNDLQKFNYGKIAKDYPIHDQNYSGNGLVEGSPEAYEMDANMARGANYGLLDEVENIIQPEYVPEQNQYINEAQQSRDSMMEDAQISAFMAAEAMGDTSEENMNNLLTAELDKRGL